MTQPNHIPDPALAALLEFVRITRGFDFSGYKLTTLTRRFRKRMDELEIDDFASYQDYLEVHPGEFERLFNTLLINVTAFFRDAEAWGTIQGEVIPTIVRSKNRYDSIRVWSVGCASGQEAYTLAISIAEQLGINEFCRQVKIYATDVDQEALTQARHAVYTEAEIEPLSAEQREQFFTPHEGGYVFRRDMRRKVIFGRHDLMQDAPISKIDLLVCRNTLMYFNAETQHRILNRFRFALNDGGFIFLGKAEMLLAHSDAFTTLNLKHRIFRKLSSIRVSNDLRSTQSDTPSPDQASFTHDKLRELAFDSSPEARLILNQEGWLVLINAQARDLFNLTSAALGRPLRDLELSYRPVELRSRIDEAIEQRRSVVLRGVRWYNTERAENIYLDVQVQPLFDTSNTIVGISINFTDVTRYKLLRQELEHSKQELEVAYEELQSTNEELETTNEELQSSNEELETTNEELQSTNEELETMNEELQSTNEELQTVNDELHNSSEELNRSNAFLEAILASLRRAVIVLDSDLVIQVWNSQAEELWGIRTDEAIGRHLLNLDIGLPLDELRQPLLDCIGGETDPMKEFDVKAVNRRGRRINCRVICSPLVVSKTDEEREVQGVILSIEDHLVPDSDA